MSAQLTENAKRVLKKRYLRREGDKVVETPDEMFRRVAENIAKVDGDVYGKSEEEVEQTAQEFYEMMSNLEFLPNSPTLMNAGTDLQQLAACFVLPVEDSMESIFDSIKHAALIHKSGGGTGFSFSRLRPKNDVVRSTGGVASGPVSFMKVFNAATEAVKQGGRRRGANMGVLRVDHPDILEFISAKEDSAELTNFNISVALTKEFMQALKEEGEYKLVNPRNGAVVGKLKAQEVFDRIVDAAWNNGEPGIVFLDRINADNPTPELGEIESTNPCSEQPLLPYESCCLGSINLARMGMQVVKRVDWEKLQETVSVDWEKLRETVWKAVHFLDNVIDANHYPLPEIEAASKATRKIGLGVMGWAEMLIQLGIPYDSKQALELARKVMSFIRTEGQRASMRLAEERGVFPAFDKSIYAGTDTRLRNATITTIAPTGTISIIASTSSGIEPLFGVAFTRNVLDGDRLIEINSLFEQVAKERGFYSEGLMEKVAEKGSIQEIDEIPEDVRRVFVSAHDITPEWHVRMQAAFQTSGVDNAVSKTVNLPADATKEDVRKVFMLAYELGCKGITVYRAGSREGEVLTKGSDDSRSGRGEKRGEVRHDVVPRKRPVVTVGSTERIRTGCGNLYVTINEDDEGICELFAAIGKQGGCAAAFSEATARLVSLALRTGVKPEAICKELRGIRCPNPVWDNGETVLSCPDAIAIVMNHYLARGQARDESGNGTVDTNDGMNVTCMGACPECGGHVTVEGGCVVCHYCGYSRCG